MTVVEPRLPLVLETSCETVALYSCPLLGTGKEVMLQVTWDYLRKESWEANLMPSLSKLPELLAEAAGGAASDT